MTIAAILPTTGDPYITGLWLNSFKKTWGKEVDSLYVCMNSGVDQPVADYVAQEFEKLGAHVIKYRGFTDHGQAIRYCLEACTDDMVFLSEDDFYVLRTGEIARLIRRVSSNLVDCIVSPRSSCSSGIHGAIVSRFNLIGLEANEPNFWPCLAIIKRSLLMETDLWFNSKNFVRGVLIPELQWTPGGSEECGDTFVWTSIQLRCKRLRFQLEPQYRLTTEDIKQQKSDFPWVHFGSTSTTFNGSLLDADGTMLGVRGTSKGPKMSLPYIPDEHLREDYERRVSLWKLCLHRFPIPPDSPASYFNKDYSEAIDRLITGCSLSPQKIQSFMNIYTRILAPVLVK
jgi:hypothetical protein